MDFCPQCNDLVDMASHSCRYPPKKEEREFKCSCGKKATVPGQGEGAGPEPVHCFECWSFANYG